MKLACLALALTSTLLWVQDNEPSYPEVGEPAPTFRLNDHAGQLTPVGGEHELWTVVAFYPKAMTPG